MIIDHRLQKLIKIASISIVSFALVCIVGVFLLQEERIVNNFGGGNIGKYYWYIISTFFGQSLIVFVSFKTLNKLSDSILNLLVLLSAYFFAIILTPARISKVIPTK